MKLRSLTSTLLLSLALFSGTATAQYKQSLTNRTVLLNNERLEIPFQNLSEKRIAVLIPKGDRLSTFAKQLERYAEVCTFDFEHIDEQIKYFNQVIVAVEAQDLNSALLEQLQQASINNKQLVLALFGSGAFFPELEQVDFPLLWNSSATADAQRYAAMSIFGGIAVTAKLPQNFSSKYRQDQGFITQQTRLQYLQGEASSYNIPALTQQIDAIVAEAIQEQASPGAVVMVVKEGQVIFEKAYGYHTYDRKIKNQITDIFDLASISKIVGTTPVIMKLQQEQVIHLDSTMGYYLGQAKQSNKKDIKLRSVLLHEAGFTPFIPFYRHLKDGDIQSYYSDSHQVKLADSVYLRSNYYRDIMWPEMLSSEVKPIGHYVYSDLSMYVMKEVAEHQTSIPMQDYVRDLLYKPLGMKTAGYNPRTRFAKENIIPTEMDTSFRKVLLEGYVHDQGAAMAAGVAGHAGLFSTANDLAIFGQLMLNRGIYGGVRIFNPETVDLFSSKQSTSSRRGLGFDRADGNPQAAYPSKLANASVYGHTGYTGTCIWIDPQNQLIYIFLSNRVHPQVSTKLLDLNIRSRIQDVIYKNIN